MIEITPQNTLLAGFRFSHHASGSGYDMLAQHLPVTYVDADNFPFVAPWGTNKRRLNMFLFDFYLKIATSKYKIIHFLYPENHLGFTLKPFAKVKKIATIHLKLDWHHKTQRHEFNSLKEYTFAKIKRMAFNDLDGIITLTSATIPEIEKKFPKAKTKFIPHGIEDNSHYFQYCSDNHAYFRIITIGVNYRDFDTYKAIVGYALQHEKNWQFNLVGVDEYWRNYFKSYPNVVIHSYLENNAYFKLLNSCDVHLFPIVFSTANNALLEAHSLGIPSVVSALPTAKDYATAQTLFFSNPMEAIMHLKFYEQMEKETFNTIRQQIKKDAKRFLWENIAQEVINFYQEIQ